MVVVICDMAEDRLGLAPTCIVRRLVVPLMLVAILELFRRLPPAADALDSTRPLILP